MFFPFLEKPLYLIPKAHPSSEKPYLEWRLSFSIVEKNIFESVKYIFRKVNLLCKTLTATWQMEYHFLNYALKTVFLWTYEDWEKSKKEFTEDDILEMVLQLFCNFYKYCKEKVVPMYFIPEVNILDQYPEIIEGVLIKRLKSFTNLQSLSLSICEHFQDQFSKEFDPDSFQFLDSFLHYSSICLQPSYFGLPYLCREKCLENKGIFGDEGKLELTHELYITLLFMLKRLTIIKFYDSSDDQRLLHILCYLMVYGYSYIPHRIISQLKVMPVPFINMYATRIKKFLSTFFPNDVSPIFKVSLDDKIRERTQSILLQSFKEEKLPKKWFDEDFNNHDILFLHEWHRFGNKEHSEKIHKQIMSEETFFTLE